VNQPAADLQRKTKQPENYENYQNCPEHSFSLLLQRLITASAPKKTAKSTSKDNREVRSIKVKQVGEGLLKQEAISGPPEQEGRRGQGSSRFVEESQCRDGGPDARELPLRKQDEDDRLEFEILKKKTKAATSSPRRRSPKHNHLGVPGARHSATP
jgi:hypothetical protein